CGLWLLRGERVAEGAEPLREQEYRGYLYVVEPLVDARHGRERARERGHRRDDEEGQLDDEHHGVRKQPERAEPDQRIEDDSRGDDRHPPAEPYGFGGPAVLRASAIQTRSPCPGRTRVSARAPGRAGTPGRRG